MSFEWFVARRYLTARRKQAFISLISGVSILGVGVGVMALVIALALMTGVQSELRDRIVGSTAHVYVYKLGGFDDVEADVKRLVRPGVTGAAPAVLGYGLARSARDESTFITLKGIDPAREPGVTELARGMKSGSIAALGQTGQARDGIVLGVDLAQTLGVSLGDPVEIITDAGTLTPFGMGVKRQILTVVGTFQIGFYEFDTLYGLVSLSTAQRLLRQAGPDRIQLRLARMDQAPEVKAALQNELGPNYHVEDWTDYNSSLYSALWLEKVAISLAIGLIVTVAALNIVASLVLLVMEKSRDIAILRTMGASARSIRRIFIYQGLAIGLIGTVAGTVLGVIVSRIADANRLIKLRADVYQITYLPFHVEPLDVVIVMVSAILICLLATIYPARQAGRLDPAEALRHE